MAPAQSSGGLATNLASALSYLFIPAIIFLAIEPYNRDRTVRFHAFQGLFLGIASIVGHIVLSFIPIIGWIIMPFWGLAIFILAVIAAVKAYGNSKFKVPVLGDMAEKQANA
jgi:uncharacterized membrane protein